MNTPGYLKELHGWGKYELMIISEPCSQTITPETEKEQTPGAMSSIEDISCCQIPTSFTALLAQGLTEGAVNTSASMPAWLLFPAFLMELGNCSVMGQMPLLVT